MFLSLSVIITSSLINVYCSIHASTAWNLPLSCNWTATCLCIFAPLLIAFKSACMSAHFNECTKRIGRSFNFSVASIVIVCLDSGDTRRSSSNFSATSKNRGAFRITRSVLVREQKSSLWKDKVEHICTKMVVPSVNSPRYTHWHGARKNWAKCFYHLKACERAIFLQQSFLWFTKLPTFF